jgi:hypothetical protein
MFGMRKAKGHEQSILQVVSAIVGGAVIGGAATIYGADKASSASQKAIDEQRNALSSQQKMEAPWMAAGTQALGNLQAGMQPGGAYNSPFTAANFQNTPAYQFQMQQGQQGINQQMASQGLTLSGAQAQGLSSFNQGLAATQYQQQYSNAMNQQQQQFSNQNTLSAQGQAAASNQAANIGGAASNISNLTVGAGNIQASGILGVGQAAGGALTSLGQQSYMQHLQDTQAQTQLATMQGAFNPNTGINAGSAGGPNVPGINSGVVN